MRSPAKPRPYQEEAQPLRVADPTLASGLRDTAAASVISLGSRYPGDAQLSAKAAGRVWSVGGGASDGGRVTCWSSTTGQMMDSAACASCVTAVALVPTVRPAAPLRAKGPRQNASGGGGADGFACELLLWAGTADGRISIYAAADLHNGPRAVLSGHRSAISCLHSPSPPPTSPAQGAAIVLSAAPDCEVRLWDARSGDCLRSIPCEGAPVVAMLALWDTGGGTATSGGNGRGPRCRVWSAAANRTLSIWKPQLPPAQAAARPTQVQSIGLGADVTALAASTDGRFVGAVAGADGVIVLDGLAHLRGRLQCDDGSSATAVLFIGRGRQVWVARERGGVDLWDRIAPTAGAGTAFSPAQQWVRSRRLPSPPLSCLCAVGLSHVWGGAGEGTLHCWMSDAALAEATAILRRAAAAGASIIAAGGASTGDGGAARVAPHAMGEGVGDAGGGPLVQALLRLLRLSLAERCEDRAFLSTQHQHVQAAVAHAEILKRTCRRWADAAASAEARLDASEAARCDLVARLEGSESQLEAHRREARRSVVEVLESRRTVKATALGSEAQRGRLATLEAELSDRAARERDMARSLAEARVAAAAARASTERTCAEAEVARVAFTAQLEEVRIEVEAAHEAAAEMEMEAATAAEALRGAEVQLEQARAEAAAARAEAAAAGAAAMAVAHSAGEVACAEVAAERRQLREANSRMHTLLRRVRERLGEPILHEATTVESETAWQGWASPLADRDTPLPQSEACAGLPTDDIPVPLAPRPRTPMPYSFAAALDSAPPLDPNMLSSSPSPRRAESGTGCYRSTYSTAPPLAPMTPPPQTLPAQPATGHYSTACTTAPPLTPTPFPPLPRRQIQSATCHCHATSPCIQSAASHYNYLATDAAPPPEPVHSPPAVGAREGASRPSIASLHNQPHSGVRDDTSRPATASLHNQPHIGGKGDAPRPSIASRRPGVFGRLSQPRTGRPRQEAPRPKDSFASPQRRLASVGGANDGGGRARAGGSACRGGADWGGGAACRSGAARGNGATCAVGSGTGSRGGAACGGGDGCAGSTSSDLAEVGAGRPRGAENTARHQRPSGGGAACGSVAGTASRGGAGTARGAVCGGGSGAARDALDQGRDALTAAATSALPFAAASPDPRPLAPSFSVLVERRSADLLLQIMTVREWLSDCLGVALPPDDLPQLLQDGQILFRLAALAAPETAAGIAPSPGGADNPTHPTAHTCDGRFLTLNHRASFLFNVHSHFHSHTPPSPTARLYAFVAVSRHLGVPEAELLVPEALLHPEPQLPVSRGTVLALASFAREAAARGLLPPLEL